MSKAYYSDTIVNFLAINEDELIGKLNLAGTEYSKQFAATNLSWDKSILVLKRSLAEMMPKKDGSGNWQIFFEYEIPRLLKRIDVVIIADDLIFVLEFKMDRDEFRLADRRQVEDYALDLSYFHLESRQRKIIPILLAPNAPSKFEGILKTNKSTVVDCQMANERDLPEVILTVYDILHDYNAQKIDWYKWESSEYKPSPSIIQAAEALFAGQKVESISRSDADAHNLSETTEYILSVINKAKEQNTKMICFVTGVPGAGKTLVGLKLVHDSDDSNLERPETAYFSGNGPLITVMREALARDNFRRENSLFEKNERKDRPLKSESERKIKSKIQNLHSFIKEYIRRKSAPPERIAIFDEAQRCWSALHFSNKSKQNQNREAVPFEIPDKSEAELLLEFMSRHEGWAVIIALIGGGQEINTGEAGIGEWGRALSANYSNWQIHISPQLLQGDLSIANQLLYDSIPGNITLFENSSLHLKTSQRAFRAASLNVWVNSVIANNPNSAVKLFNEIKETYPILVTRDLEKAKKWLRSKVIGTKRIGLIASSGALRLRPIGIDIRGEIDEAFWFLNDEKDIRSSYYLEIVASEYKVQGLELDWVGVCWDADLRRLNNNWDYKKFSGTNWQKVSVNQDKQYLLNKYRVLLTRAREGMIIFIPEGDDSDYTRLSSFYDPIYEYLKSCGIDELK